VVLHALRVKGFAEVEAVAELTALPIVHVQDELEAARRAGDAERRERGVPGWALTSAGRSRHAVWLAADVDASGAAGLVVDAARQFSEFNARFERVCTEWQLRVVEGRYVPNRHDDTAYDRSVVAELHPVDELVQPVCVALSRAFTRMSAYGRRLSAALARVDAGDQDAFTRPLTDSYLDIWTELHEDLVATMSVATTAVDA
jgi:hypothetical protein